MLFDANERDHTGARWLGDGHEHFRLQGVDADGEPVAGQRIVTDRVVDVEEWV